MHLLTPILIVLVIVAAAIYLVPSARKYVLVTLGLQTDITKVLSMFTKLVAKLEAHAEDEAAKAKAATAAAEAATANAVKASNVAANVKKLIGA